MDLNVYDLLLITHNFEPSRIKIWEIARRYDPIQFSALLYLLENVSASRKKEPITLDDDRLYKLCESRAFNRNVLLELWRKPILRIDHVEKTRVQRFAATRTECSSRIRLLETSANETTRRAAIEAKLKFTNTDENNANILRLLDYIRMPETYDFHDTPNLYTNIVLHNFGTTHYHALLSSISYLLFSDNYQTDRSEMRTSEFALHV